MCVCGGGGGGGGSGNISCGFQRGHYTPPQTLFVGGILFSRCPSVRPSVRNALFP